MTSAERMREWRKANPKKDRLARARYRAKNKAKLQAKSRAYSQRYRATHEIDKAAEFRAWYSKNARKRNRYTVARRAAQRASGKYSVAEWDAIVASQRGRCLDCGRKTKLTADHVNPLKAGAVTTLSTWQRVAFRATLASVIRLFRAPK